jgi:hypothetical protein
MTVGQFKHANVIQCQVFIGFKIPYGRQAMADLGKKVHSAAKPQPSQQAPPRNTQNTRKPDERKATDGTDDTEGQNGRRLSVPSVAI